MKNIIVAMLVFSSILSISANADWQAPPKIQVCISNFLDWYGAALEASDASTIVDVCNSESGLNHEPLFPINGEEVRFMELNLKKQISEILASRDQKSTYGPRVSSPNVESMGEAVQ